MKKILSIIILVTLVFSLAAAPAYAEGANGKRSPAPTQRYLSPTDIRSDTKSDNILFTGEQTIFNRDGICFAITEIHEGDGGFKYFYKVENNTDKTIKLSANYCYVNGVDIDISCYETVSPRSTNEGNFTITRVLLAYAGVSYFSSFEMQMTVRDNESYDILFTSKPFEFAMDKSFFIEPCEYADLKLFSGPECDLILRGAAVNTAYGADNAPRSIISLYILCRSYLDDEIMIENEEGLDVYVNDEVQVGLIAREIRPHSVGLTESVIICDECYAQDEVLTISIRELACGTLFGIDVFAKGEVGIVIMGDGSVFSSVSTMKNTDSHLAPTQPAQTEAPRNNSSGGDRIIQYTDNKTGKVRELLEMKLDAGIFYVVRMDDYWNSAKKYPTLEYVDLYDNGSSVGVFTFQEPIRNCAGVAQENTINPTSPAVFDLDWLFIVRTDNGDMYAKDTVSGDGESVINIMILPEGNMDLYWWTTAPEILGSEGFYASFGSSMFLFRQPQYAADFLTNIGV